MKTQTKKNIIFSRAILTLGAIIALVAGCGIYQVFYGEKETFVADVIVVVPNKNGVVVKDSSGKQFEGLYPIDEHGDTKLYKIVPEGYFWEGQKAQIFKFTKEWEEISENLKVAHAKVTKVVLRPSKRLME